MSRVLGVGKSFVAVLWCLRMVEVRMKVQMELDSNGGPNGRVCYELSLLGESVPFESCPAFCCQVCR
jgi:hypothetical protein